MSLHFAKNDALQHRRFSVLARLYIIGQDEIIVVIAIAGFAVHEPTAVECSGFWGTTLKLKIIKIELGTTLKPWNDIGPF